MVKLEVRSIEFWNFVRLYSDENVLSPNVIFRHHKFPFRAQHFSLAPGLFGLIGDELSFSSLMILIFFLNIYLVRNSMFRRLLSLFSDKNISHPRAPFL